jgi:hypothetical protein
MGQASLRRGGEQPVEQQQRHLVSSDSAGERENWRQDTIDALVLRQSLHEEDRAWYGVEKHRGEPIVTGSKLVDLRAVLAEQFRLVNRASAADQRVFERLSEKFRWSVMQALSTEMRGWTVSEFKPAYSPDQQLARIIAESLAREGIVPKTRFKELAQKLAAGSMREADWRLLVELATPEVDEVDSDGQGNRANNAAALPRSDDSHGADL